MNKKLYKAVLAAICASMLCGCFDYTQRDLVVFDRGTSDTAASDKQNGATYQPPDLSQIVQSTPETSSTSSDLTISDVPVTGSELDGQIVNEETTRPSISSSTSSSSSSRSSSSSSSRSSSSSSSRSSSSSSSRSSSSSSSRSSSSSSTSSEDVPSQQSIITPPFAAGSTLEDYTLKWAYNNITNKQKQIYSRLYLAVYDDKSEFDISDLDVTSDDIYIAYWAFDYDNPQFLELGSGYKYSYTESQGIRSMISLNIIYGRTSGEVPQSEFDRIAQGVIANAQAKPNDYEKLKYVHDWIVNNTVYIKADTDYESEADGPVVYGKAICEGYSKAFMYFAQSMGYECVCVIGSAGGVDHMWNMVKIGGQWYHVDTTWDDPVMSDGSQTLRYNYFLLSDSAISQDHSFSTPFTQPSAPYSYIQ